MQDLVGSQIDLMCAEASQTLAHVRGGKMKAFAMMSKNALGAAAGRADHGRDRRSGHGHAVLARAVGAEGHAQGRRRQAQRARWWQAFADPAVQKRIAELGMKFRPREQQTPEALRGLSQGRDRQMVADHQGAREASIDRQIKQGSRRNVDEEVACCRRARRGRRPGRTTRRPFRLGRSPIVVPLAAGGSTDTIGAHHGRRHAAASRPDR